MTAYEPLKSLVGTEMCLRDSTLNVIYTRSMHDLSKAEWAIANREDYMRIVRERTQHCPVCSNVVICEDRGAPDFLPSACLNTSLPLILI